MNNFRFKINVSVEGYNTKDEARQCITKSGADALGKHTLGWKEEFITCEQFLKYAESGHTFAHIFNLFPGKGDTPWLYGISGKKGLRSTIYIDDPNPEYEGTMKVSTKRLALFKESQTIFIDVDETKASGIQEYIQKLHFKPTIAYPSYSDGRDKNGIISRRFHLVYIFDQPLNKKQFTLAAELFTRIAKENTQEEVDNCSKVLSQMFYGCSSIKDGGYDETYIYNYKVLEFSINCLGITYDEKNISEKDIPVDDTFLGELYGIWKRDKSYKNFNKIQYSKYGRRTFYDKRDESQWKTTDNVMGYVIKYQEVGDDNFTLYFNDKKIKDGGNRRKILYLRMALRRILKPDVGIEDIIFNATSDIENFIDNTTDPIIPDEILQRARYVFSYTIEDLMEIKEIKSSLEWHIKNRGTKKGVVYDKNESLSSKEMEEIKNIDEVQKIYDSGITKYKDIAEKADLSEDTVQKAFKIMGKNYKISTTEKIKELYESGITKCKDIAEKTGLSESTVKRYIRDLGLNRENLIRELYESGITKCKDIAEKTGLSENTVKRYIRDLGLSKKDKKQEIERLYESGITEIKDLVEKTGLSENTVRKCLKMERNSFEDLLKGNNNNNPQKENNFENLLKGNAPSSNFNCAPTFSGFSNFKDFDIPEDIEENNTPKNNNLDDRFIGGWDYFLNSNERGF